jgi:hypothetical protein
MLNVTGLRFVPMSYVTQQKDCYFHHRVSMRALVAEILNTLFRKLLWDTKSS